MTTDRSLRTLEATAERKPERIDARTLCAFLGSDEAEERNRAQEIRDHVLENVTDPSSTVDALCDLLDDSDDAVRRAAVETLYRFGRVWPREVTSAVAPELESSDVRRRAAAVDLLGRTRDGAAVGYAPALVDALDDPDDRVAALATDAVANLADPFPAAVVDAVPAVRPFLEDEWIPTDDGGARLVYSRDYRESNPENSEPRSARLTSRVPRPFESARSFLETLALTHPEALERVVPRLCDLVASPPTGARVGLPALLRTLTRVARTDPSLVEDALPAVERHAEAESGEVRVAARNLLDELGREVGRPEPVAAPSSMATRNRPERDGDERLLSGIDQRAIVGDVDIDAIVDLLYCVDADVRDHAAWGLECGFDQYVGEIHDRGEIFLSLLDEPDDCTRTHLLTAMGPVVRTYPEEWMPPLLELTTRDDPVVRAGAVRLLSSAAGTYPALVRTEIGAIADRLSDVSSVQAAAFLSLRSLVEAVPDATVPHAPAAVDALEEPETRIESLRFLEALARVRPTAVGTHAESLETLVATLAGSDRIGDRARVSRTGGARVDADDRALEAAFRVCLRLATTAPGTVEAIRPHAERVVDGRYYGHRPAFTFLAALDGSR